MMPLPLFAALGGCPEVASILADPGFPLRAPREPSSRLNQEGSALYREQRWDQARARFSEALAADPTYRAALLNRACAWARAQNFPRAVADAVTLLHDGYVPWAKEIDAAADLAPLRTTKAWATLEHEAAQAAMAWGQGLEKAVIFVARLGPPLRLSGSGHLVLGLKQEIFAWLPGTGQFRQVSAEGKRILAVARSQDGRHLLYVTGGQLLRQPGQRDHLNGLHVRILETVSLKAGRAFAVPGDILRVALSFDDAGRATLDVISDQGTARWIVSAEGLRDRQGEQSQVAAATVLTTEGVLPITGPRNEHAPREVKSRAGVWEIQFRNPQGCLQKIKAPFGVGLRGLPFNLEGADRSARF